MAFVAAPMGFVEAVVVFVEEAVVGTVDFGCMGSC